MFSPYFTREKIEVVFALGLSAKHNEKIDAAVLRFRRTSVCFARASIQYSTNTGIMSTRMFM